MTTDRKNFIFTARRGIMEKTEYPGVVQLIERVVWDHEAESLSLSTRTKIPLKSLISEGFFLFFVYCGAGGEYDNKNDFKTNCWYSLYVDLLSEMR